MKKIVCFLIFFSLAHIAVAQQLPIYSQYLYNKFLINPAHAGSDGFVSFNMTAREQWIGYTGAPRTFSLSGQARILKRGYKLQNNLFNKTRYRPKTDGKVGLGGYIFSDKNGIVLRTGFQTTYSYHMWLADYTQLSLGLALEGYHFIVKSDESSFEDPNDPWLNDNLRKGVFVPDADFGVYLLNPNYDVGFSCLQLFGSAAKIGEEAYKNYQMYRHYYLFGSYTFKADVRTELEPSALIKMSELLKPQADLTLTYVYDRTFWAGLTYRTGGAMIANFRFKFVPSNVMLTTMYFGYAFDFSMNKIQKATYGTHEITIALKFGDPAKRFRWLDRYS
jgi:type IX secretion system PorP/SprF family membrane protein